jgi:DNA-binding IclR family transcriptional regulator
MGREGPPLDSLLGTTGTPSSRQCSTARTRCSWSGRRSVLIGSRVGGRLPAYATATGKVFLAFGPPEYRGGSPPRRRAGAADAEDHRRARAAAPRAGADLARGYGTNREEAEVGVSAVAAPVFDHRRR